LLGLLFITIIYLFLRFFINDVYLLFVLQGEYRVVFEKAYPCESTNLFQFNWYLSKKTLSITEMKGNFTFKIPMDDHFTVRTYRINK